MSEYSYSIRIGVDKELPPVSSGDYDVDFCSSGAANQTPPKLQISLAAFGTAAVDGVIAECYTVGTSNVNILPSSPFATATASWVYLRESSGHAAADIAVGETAVGFPILRFKAGDAALFRRDAAVAYSLAASSASTASTGTIQVVVIGD